MTDTLSDGARIGNIWDQFRTGLTGLDESSPSNRQNASSRPGLIQYVGLVTLIGISDFEHTASISEDPSRTLAVPRWLNYVTVRLNDMAARREPLEDLPIPSAMALRRAFQVAFSTFPPDMPAPSVGTTLEGGVEFAWHRNGWDLEISVTPDEQTVWARKRSSGEMFEASWEDSAAFVDSLLESFSQ